MAERRHVAGVLAAVPGRVAVKVMNHLGDGVLWPDLERSFLWQTASTRCGNPSLYEAPPPVHPDHCRHAKTRLPTGALGLLRW